MSTTLKAIADKLGGTTTSDAVSYIGKTVLTPGDIAVGNTGGGLSGAVELDADASSVVVAISDANGQLLKTVDLGERNVGSVDYEWNGKLADGADAGPGPYTVQVQARSGTRSVAARNLVWAPVAAVAVPSAGPAQLTIPGLGQVSVTAVRKIG